MVANVAPADGEDRMADETPSIAALTQDRGLPIGNSEDTFGRRAAHVKVANKVTEPIPVSGTFSSSPGGFSPPANTDACQVSYPNATTEVYEFYTGGLAGTLLQTNTVVYTDSTKNFIDNVVKT